ncbi:hypothetical protein K525DRAFT_247731 [Schizophyllum commune Loenen D]|nr:hypothetical protein K525DRAFT_247731 [Schizophyllum commune Loenen D]
MDHLSRQFSCTSIEDFEELDRAAKARKAEKAAEAQRAAEAEAAANAVEEEVLGVGVNGGVDGGVNGGVSADANAGMQEDRSAGMQEDRSTIPTPIPGRHRRALTNAHYGAQTSVSHGVQTSVRHAAQTSVRHGVQTSVRHGAQPNAHLPPRSRRIGGAGPSTTAHNQVAMNGQGTTASGPSADAQDDGDATEIEDNGSDTEMEEDDRPRLTGNTNLDASAMTREERRAIAAEVLRGMLGPVNAPGTNNNAPFVAGASSSKPAFKSSTTSKSSTKPPSTSSNKPPSSRNLIARSSTANLLPIRISRPLGGTARAKPLGGTTRAARGVEIPREVGVPRQVDVPPEQGVPRGVEVSRGVVKASVGQARLISAPPGVACVPAAAVARRNALRGETGSAPQPAQGAPQPAQSRAPAPACGTVPPAQPARSLATVAAEVSFSSTKAEFGSPTFSQHRLPPPLAPSTPAQVPPVPGQAATTILRVPRFFARSPRSTVVQAPNLEQVAHPAQDLVPDQEGHPTPPLSPAVLEIWKQHMIEAFQQHMAAAVAARADELAAREEMLRCRGAQIAVAYKMARTALEQQRAALVREEAALAARKRELAETMARARQATLVEQQELAGRRQACERQEQALAQQQEALAQEHQTCEQEWRQAYEQQRQAYEQQLAYARQHQYHEQQRWAYPPQQTDAHQMQLVHAPQASTSAVQLPAPAYHDSQPAFAARWTAANQADQPPATNNLTLNVWAPNLNAQDLSGVFNSWSRRQ